MASADQAPPPRVADECPAHLYAPHDRSGGLRRFIGASRPPPPGRLDVSRALSLPTPRSAPRAAARGAARSRAAAYIPHHHIPPSHPLCHRRSRGALVPWLEGSAAPRTLLGRSAYRGPDGSVGPRLTCSCVRQSTTSYWQVTFQFQIIVFAPSPSIFTTVSSFVFTLYTPQKCTFARGALLRPRAPSLPRPPAR